MKRLLNILQMKRAHGSTTLDEFVAVTFAGYETETYRNPKGDPLALVIYVGTSRTLFSCHLDTVHTEGGRQEVVFDGKTFSLSNEVDELEDFTPSLTPLSKYKPYKAGCLGADDGAGVWLMLEMIDACVPGAYVLHFGEEKGGIGSSGMASHHPDFLSKFDRAVAFDRRGTSSVITHQGFGRCCSDTFAEALCAALGDANPKLDLFPDSTGIFTDTANYIDDIGECTNISCGYKSEHSRSETLDYEFLCNLLDGLVKVDWESLPTDRQPGEEEVPAYNAWGGYGSLSRSSYALDDLEYLAEMRYADLLAWVKKHDSESIADVLYEALAEMQPVAPQSGPFYEEDDLV